MKSLALLALTFGILTAKTASANIVVNGSFEDPAIPSGSFSYLPSIPGWTLASGPAIEVQNHVAGSPYDGNQFVELDSSANSSMYQDLHTVAGQAYELSFAYSARPGVAADSTGIDVFAGGTQLADIAMNGTGLSDTAWTLVTFDFTATSDTTRLQFTAVGASDSLGGYIDAVSVNAVPEPSSLAMCGIAGVVGLVARRRRK